MARAMSIEIQPQGMGGRDHLGRRGFAREVERAARGDVEGERATESAKSDLG
jgi:hypothetical protein